MSSPSSQIVHQNGMKSSTPPPQSTAVPSTPTQASLLAPLLSSKKKKIAKGLSVQGSSNSSSSTLSSQSSWKWPTTGNGLNSLSQAFLVLDGSISTLDELDTIAPSLSDKISSENKHIQQQVRPLDMINPPNRTLQSPFATNPNVSLMFMI